MFRQVSLLWCVVCLRFYCCGTTDIWLPSNFTGETDGRCTFQEYDCNKIEGCSDCKTCYSAELFTFAKCEFDIFQTETSDACSSKPTYFEISIPSIELPAGHCFTIGQIMNRFTLCSHGKFSGVLGSGPVGVSETYCGGVSAKTHRTVTSEVFITADPESVTDSQNVTVQLILSERFYRVPQKDPENPQCACPEGYIEHKCICYSLVSDGGKEHWYGAEQKCASEGGHLLSIADEDEMTDIKHFLRSVWWRLVSGEELPWIYIGLSDEASAERMESKVTPMRWVDSNPVTFTEWYHPAFKTWVADLDQGIIKSQAQPSALSTFACTVMYITMHHWLERSHWFKIPCKLRIENVVFICKRWSSVKNDNRKALKIYQTHLMSKLVTCASGWIYFEGRCVMMFTSGHELTYAVPPPFLEFELCIQHNSTVVNIKSKEEPNFINFAKMLLHREIYGFIVIKVEYSFSHVTVKTTSNEKDEEQLFRDFYFDPYDHTGNKYGSIADVIPFTPNIFCERPVIESEMECKRHQFLCGDGSCISTEYVCDGRMDCDDGSDEVECDNEAIVLFTCDNDEQIPFSLYCDFIHHCTDGSDEVNCIHAQCSDGHFNCNNGQCIPFSQTCDLIEQCLDGSDEIACPYCRGFECYSGKCIPVWQTYDIYSDCPGISNEDEQISVQNIWRGLFFPSAYITGYMMENNLPYCAKEDEVRCKTRQTKCVPRSNICVFDADSYGVTDGCRDGSHLRDCKDFECPGMFKCPESYCIPVRKRCNGVWDCPYGADEIGCDNVTCSGFLRCRGELFCLDQSEVCDGVINCLESQDDEKLCDVTLCPTSCTCHGRSVACPDKNLTEITTFSTMTRYLNLTRNLLTNVTLYKFYYLGRLDLSYNKIYDLSLSSFSDTYNLLHLDLGYNIIRTLHPFTFSSLSRLLFLRLTGNDILTINSNSFYGLRALPSIDLSHQNMTELTSFTFNGTWSLKHINLSYNHLRAIDVDALQGLSNISYLTIEHNPLEMIKPEVFRSAYISKLETDKYAFCCVANQDTIRAEGCTPLPDEFSSCSDLLANPTLKVCIWVLAALGVFGNLFVLIWRLVHRKEGNNENALVISLTLADLLMGVYLLVIASADRIYEGKYVSYAEQWKGSPVCTLAGILSFVSSEVSVFMLVLITADRVIAIVFTFKMEKLTLKKILVILPTAWTIIIVASVVAIWLPGMYGLNGVCLPFSLGMQEIGGQLYSVVFLTINLIAFILIAVGYLMIYRTIKQSRRRIEKHGKIQDNRQELAFLKKMSLVILTDLLCWVPIVFLKYLSLGGIHLPSEVAAWTAVFILPLNSSLNPQLYTISAIQFKYRKSQLTKSPGMPGRSGESAASIATVSSRI